MPARCEAAHRRRAALALVLGVALAGQTRIACARWCRPAGSASVPSTNSPSPTATSHLTRHFRQRGQPLEAGSGGLYEDDVAGRHRRRRAGGVVSATTSRGAAGARSRARAPGRTPTTSRAALGRGSVRSRAVHGVSPARICPAPRCRGTARVRRPGRLQRRPHGVGAGVVGVVDHQTRGAVDLHPPDAGRAPTGPGDLAEVESRRWRLPRALETWGRQHAERAPTRRRR